MSKAKNQTAGRDVFDVLRENLRAHMGELSIAEFARDCGVCRQTMHVFLTGRRRGLSLNYLQQVANGLGVELADLVTPRPKRARRSD